MLRLASYTFLVVALNSEGVVRIWDARLEYHRYILMILDPIFDTILFIVEFWFWGKFMWIIFLQELFNYFSECIPNLILRTKFLMTMVNGLPRDRAIFNNRTIYEIVFLAAFHDKPIFWIIWVPRWHMTLSSTFSFQDSTVVFLSCKRTTIIFEETWQRYFEVILQSS